MLQECEAMAGIYGRVESAGRRCQQRQVRATRGAERQVRIFQRPFQGELRRIVAPVRLVELGIGDRRVQRPVLDDLGQLRVADA
jgi:hypothetical protein